MFWHLLRMESSKMYRRRLLWIGLIVALLPMVIPFVALFQSSQQTSAVGYWIWPGGLISSLSFANGFAPGYGYSTYLLAIVISVVTAQEYSWRTMQLWLSHGISRLALLLAKFTLALITIMLVVFIFMLVGGVISLIQSFQLHGGLPSSTIDSMQLLLSYLRTCYGILPYMGLSFLLVIASRSATFAITGCILFMLALELPITLLIIPLFGKGYAWIAYFLPAGLAQEMNHQNYSSVHLTMPLYISAGQTSLTSATIAIAVYTLAFFGSALWIFQRQNLTN